MTNRYKHVLIIISQVKKAMSSYIDTLLPDTGAVEAVLDSLLEHLQELKESNEARRFQDSRTKKTEDKPVIETTVRKKTSMAT